MTRITDTQQDDLVAAVAAGDVTYTGAPTALPPAADSDIMAVYSVRLPATLAQQLARVAGRKGVKPSTLMREFVEAALATEEDDRPISLADAMRALATLRKAA